MVIHRLQPLYQMASSSAHDFFFQEANTLYFVHSLISRAWRHLDVTHVPLVIQALLAMCWLKKVDFDLHIVCFSWLLGCEGSGATFRGLRMRIRSTWKSAHRNAGDLGSRLAVCACAYDPIHVTAQGKRLGPNCACVQLPGSPLNKTMWTMWI